ncbi:DUF6608 family protein [Clostridium paraputrificum]|uniref:DUF6608 family protein n=1 Tax=Clostridium TaxID=1485 RepID=UPI003D34000C
MYLLAIGMVFLSIFILGLFVDISPNDYKDGFITFTIHYVIGLIIFYINLWKYINKNNEYLKLIRTNKEIE